MYGIVNYYLVDFENVGSSGLVGNGNLSNEDFVIVFFTNNAGKLNLDVLENSCNANLKFIKVKEGKQEVDKHIVSYLGYLLGQHPVVSLNISIISKDKGYEKVLEYWSNMKKNFTLCLKEKIDNYTKIDLDCEKNSKVDEKNSDTELGNSIQAYLDIMEKYDIKSSDSNSILNMIKSKNKKKKKQKEKGKFLSNFHNNLVQMLGHPKGNNLYKELKKII